MADAVEREDSRKTVVAFITGLLIGGLLVWVFSSTPATEKTTNTNTGATDTTTSAPTTNNSASNDSGSSTKTSNNNAGNSALVEDQAAGTAVTLGQADFPADKGWVVVRDYTNNVAGRILGASRYDVKAGLVPTKIELVRPTIAGNTYQVSFYTDEGALGFKSGEDKPVAGGEATFTAQ